MWVCKSFFKEPWNFKKKWLRLCGADKKMVNHIEQVTLSFMPGCKPILGGFQRCGIFFSLENSGKDAGLAKTKRSDTIPLKIPKPSASEWNGVGVG